MKEKIKTKMRSSVTLYIVLRLMVILVMIAQIFHHNWNNVFLCVLTLILFLIPVFVERRLKIDLPNLLECIILLFIFAAEILGEINEYYIHFAHWDTMLHTMNGFLAAAIGFSLIDILNENEHFSIKLSPQFVAMVAFCFSMTVGVLWEFFEFFMDNFFQMDMQKDTVLNSITSVLLNPEGRNVPITVPIERIVINGEPWNYGGYIDIGLYDTMKDLLVNFVGAVVFSVLGLFYIKKRGTESFIKKLIPTRIREKKADGEKKNTDQEQNKAGE